MARCQQHNAPLDHSEQLFNVFRIENGAKLYVYYCTYTCKYKTTTDQVSASVFPWHGATEFVKIYKKNIWLIHPYQL